MKIVRWVSLAAVALVAAEVAFGRTQGCEFKWTETTPGADPFDGTVYALEVFDEPAGPALFAAGTFESVAGFAAPGIARWDGASWSEVDGGIDGDVYVLSASDVPGLGPVLAVGGLFTSAGSTSANNVAAWTGTHWRAIGGGLLGTVRALATFDDGSGPALFAGGTFALPGDPTTRLLARWDGVRWKGVPGSPAPSLFSWVHALAAFDAGDGPWLYLGGKFTSVAGQPVTNVARWNGTSWTGLGVSLSDWVECMTVADVGEGPSLYIGGWFQTSFVPGATGIARWDGATWNPVGGGVTYGIDQAVFALETFDDGTGDRLAVAGQFGFAGGMVARAIALWDGSEWSALDEGTGVNVYSLAAYEEPSGPALFAGGNFSAFYVPEEKLARWSCVPSPAFVGLPGCGDNPGVLAALAPGAIAGATLGFEFSAPAAWNGAAWLFLGLPGTGPGDCGVAFPFGEVLLALDPAPLTVDVAALTAGTAALGVTLPAAPALVGLDVAFQAAGVAFDVAGAPLALSNGLAATVAAP